MVPINSIKHWQEGNVIRYHIIAIVFCRTVCYAALSVWIVAEVFIPGLALPSYGHALYDRARAFAFLPLRFHLYDLSPGARTQLTENMVCGRVGERGVM